MKIINIFWSNSTWKEIKYLEKYKLDPDSLRENYTGCIKYILILKSKQSFESKRHNVFTKEFNKNKIALSTNNNKIIHSTNWIETYAYGTSKTLVCKREI